MNTKTPPARNRIKRAKDEKRRIRKSSIFYLTAQLGAVFPQTVINFLLIQPEKCKYEDTCPYSSPLLSFSFC